MPKIGTCSTTVRRAVLGVTFAASAFLPSATLAEPSSPAAGQVRQPTATPSAESEYDRGVWARAGAGGGHREGKVGRSGGSPGFRVVRTGTPSASRQPAPTPS